MEFKILFWSYIKSENGQEVLENERGIVIANHGREIICEHKFVTHHELGENISGQ